VDLHLVGGLRRGTCARLERRDDEARCGARRALFGRGLVEEDLARLLFNRRRRARARSLQLLDFRRVRLYVDLGFFLEHPVADARQDRVEVGRAQVEAGEVLADHEPQGIEGFLVVGFQLGAGGAGDGSGGQNEDRGEGEGFQHRGSFLRAD
jgi:hypothetical protein